MAKQQMVSVCLKDATIPHEVFCHYGGAKVMLRPASPGTGIIAGKTVRAVVESAGVKDILSKSLGSNNPSNVVKATLAGLLQLRLREDIYRDRGIEYKKKTAAVPVPPAKAPVVPAAATVPLAPAEAPAAIRNPQPGEVLATQTDRSNPTDQTDPGQIRNPQSAIRNPESPEAAPAPAVPPPPPPPTH
jgi:hypothetical protein